MRLWRRAGGGVGSLGDIDGRLRRERKEKQDVMRPYCFIIQIDPFAL